MHASGASVSGDAAPAAGGKKTLIVGVNWLGDSIMAMPALQAYRRRNPRDRMVMLVKGRLAELWTMHAALDAVRVFPEGRAGTVQAARLIKAERFDQALILPLSFRAALAPFLAGVPRRTGFPGHWRRWMLTDVIESDQAPEGAHQCFEYMALLRVLDCSREAPCLAVPAAVLARARGLLGDAPAAWIGLMPGAARGPSKRWPAEHFAAAGRLLHQELKCNIVVLGAAAERELCGQVAAAIGAGAVNRAGETSLTELAAVLALCALLIANDSGGMHLAVAVGTPVVAVFGNTDPGKTGPLGDRARVLQESAVRRRNIGRCSRAAEASLRRVRPEQVAAAGLELLQPKAGR